MAARGFAAALSLRAGDRPARAALPGPRADAAARSLAARVPCQNLQRARELLGEGSDQSTLLALQMIEAIDGDSLLGEVLALIDDPNPTIAERAGKTSVKLVANAGLEALRILGEWKQAHPELSAIFLLSGSPHNKLQVLRWLAHDRARQQSKHRCGAAHRLSGCRLGGARDRPGGGRAAARARIAARGVGRAIAARHRRRVNADERRMVRTIQLCAVELLQGAEVPPPAGSAPDTKTAMRAHLLRCLAGEPVSHHEKAFLFITSMTTPLPG